MEQGPLNQIEAWKISAFTSITIKFLIKIINIKTICTSNKTE